MTPQLRAVCFDQQIEATAVTELVRLFARLAGTAHCICNGRGFDPRSYQHSCRQMFWLSAEDRGEQRTRTPRIIWDFRHIAADNGGRLPMGSWCPGAGSNHRHCDFQSHALPTELPGRSQPNNGLRERRFIVRQHASVHHASPCGLAWRSHPSSRWRCVFNIARSAATGALSRC